MTEELTRKKRIRAGHRGVVTRRLKEGTALLADDHPDLTKVIRLVSLLEDKLVVLRKLNEEILELLDTEEAIVTEIDGADAYEQEVQDVLLRLREAKSCSPKSEPSVLGATSHQARLPKLTLPPFDGSITRWLSFWDLYDSAVHSNPDLSDVQRFSYLKSLVEGPAREAIDGLSLSTENYREAVDILKKRFGNKQKIIDKHLSLLLNVDRVSSAHNVPALRCLYNQIEINVRALKSLGVREESYGSLLASVLVQRLPPDLRLIVGRDIKDEWNLSGIMKVLGQELETRERIATPHENESLSGLDKASDRGVVKRKEKPSAMTLTVAGQNPGDSHTSVCCYCKQGGHLPDECKVVSQVEERRRGLRVSGRCFMCLRKGHIGRDCRSRNRCRNCKGKHHRSICPSSVDGVVTSNTSSSEPVRKQATTHLLTRSFTPLNPNASPFQSMTASAMESEHMVLLQSATVTLYNPNQPENQLEATIIFDSGSQRSYISQTAVNQLNLRRCGSKLLSILTFGSREGHPQKCDSVVVGLRKDGRAIRELSLLAVPHICEALKIVSYEDLQRRYPPLSKLDLAANQLEPVTANPLVLVGLDHYWSFITGETIHCEGGPVAIRTIGFGWILSGPVPSDTNVIGGTSTSLVTHVLKVCSDSRREDGKRLERRLRAFWDLESLGILDDDHDIYDQFHQVVEFQEGRYVVPLPWKDPMTSLPDNYELCKRRLQSLVKRLRKDPDLFRQYNRVIYDQIEQGIVQLVQDPEVSEGNRIHYLPHHAVIRYDKDTTKLRVVYDASAKTGKGPSLNDSLLVGPKFNQLILDVLLRFRIFRVPLVADIEKAFLMVAVNPRDQDVLRFLWFKNWEEETPEIQVFKFTRVVFGVASSPFLLNATIRHHLEGYKSSHPRQVKRILDSTYVDDVVFGANSVDETYELYQEAKGIFREGGFNLRKFRTSVSELQARIEEAENTSERLLYDDDTYAKTVLGGSILPGELRVLGVRWKVTGDQLVFDVGGIMRAAENIPHPTKREVSSIVGRTYDPLGMLTPLITPFKVFLQDLCLAKIDWDDTLPDPLLSRWRLLVKGIHGAGYGEVTLPRCIASGGDSLSYRLCGFGDASLRAYAAVVYLLAENEDTSHYHLLCSKVRVSPVEKLTIPRLELLSALILARLVERVSSALGSMIPLQPPVCFLDSKVACYWIHGQDRSWKPFVQNRVMEIRNKVPASQWSHCAGVMNPADAPSRGQTIAEFMKNESWFSGPGKQMPTVNGENMIEMPPECVNELKSKAVSCGTPHEYVLLGSLDAGMGIDRVMDIESYSDVNRLFRVTAYLLMAVASFRGSRSGMQLTGEWIHQAEVRWVKSAQAQLKVDPRYRTWRNQFDLFEDDHGLIRCRGRLGNAAIPYTVRFPLLLPRDHCLTLLLVRQAHDKVFHNGVKETLTQLRMRYWVLKGRSLVKFVIHRCVLCRRLEGPRYNNPPPPPLPPYRVEEVPPFTYCGVDFAGPVFVRMDRAASCESKVWISLYTCCVTRAVHLDLVQDLTTQSFLRCFRRFTARRGLPKRMISDNGKTFKGAAKYIRKIMNDYEVQCYMMSGRMEWLFNIERAPWWGGFFERLIRSTKRCLTKTIGRAKLSYDELLTVLAETESILNSRPLSVVSPLDLEEPLTPSHLLLGRRLLNLPDDGLVKEPQQDEDYIPTPKQFTRRVQFLKRMMEYFWSRWRKEYLIELRTAHSRNLKNGRETKEIDEGDVVVIHDENAKRNFWRLGVVESLIQGRDGCVRGAQVRVSVKGKRNAIWKRPLKRLYPLEVGVDIDPDGARNTSQTDSDRDSSHRKEVTTDASEGMPRGVRVPKRQAARQAQNHLETLKNSNLI